MSIVSILASVLISDHIYRQGRRSRSDNVAVLERRSVTGSRCDMRASQVAGCRCETVLQAGVAELVCRANYA